MGGWSGQGKTPRFLNLNLNRLQTPYNTPPDHLPLLLAIMMRLSLLKVSFSPISLLLNNV